LLPTKHAFICSLFVCSAQDVRDYQRLALFLNRRSGCAAATSGALSDHNLTFSKVDMLQCVRGSDNRADTLFDIVNQEELKHDQ
jgi:hypothetical protein